MSFAYLITIYFIENANNRLYLQQNVYLCNQLTTSH